MYVYFRVLSNDVQLFNSIENILIIPTEKEAQAIMSNADLVPPKCSYAITHERYQYYPAPMYRSYAMNARSNRNVLLSAGVGEMTKQLQEDVEDLKQKVINLVIAVIS